jgi:hypothetical protein
VPVGEITRTLRDGHPSTGVCAAVNLADAAKLAAAAVAPTNRRRVSMLNPPLRSRRAPLPGERDV